MRRYTFQITCGTGTEIINVRTIIIEAENLQNALIQAQQGNPNCKVEYMGEYLL